MKSNRPVLLRQQLQNSKGALAFKLFSAAWAVGLLLLFLSGTILALQVKALRTLTWLSLTLGTCCFIALVWFS